MNKDLGLIGIVYPQSLIDLGLSLLESSGTMDGLFYALNLFFSSLAETFFMRPTPENIKGRAKM